MSTDSKLNEMLKEIREVVSRYSHEIDERTMYEELMAEAEGWKMWLDENPEEK
jgi:hypothetical protein